MTLVLVACAIFVVQSVLTMFQVKNYRKSVNALIGKYKGKEGFHLFSGQARRKFGPGSIAMLVVDDAYMIQECQVMRGVSIFTTFQEMEEYKGHHIGELMERLHEAKHLNKKTKRKKVPAISAALNTAAENALLSISRKSAQS